MADYTSDQILDLSSHRIPGIDLGNGLTYPYYNGRSILNIPSSICNLMGVPGMVARPLMDHMLAPVEGNIQRIILVLMDALALHRFQQWMQAGPASIWSELVDRGALQTITSITPSTTSAALTSLWTGRSATEHGITGYEMWMKEYGLIANTILHTPMSFQSGGAGSLKHAGFEPETFVQFPTLGTHLANHGVRTYALQHRSILHSGLSTILFRDVEAYAFHTATDLWINLRQLLESKPTERIYTWVYWSEVDHFGHLYGPDNERTAAEFGVFSHAMQTLFLQQLSAQLKKGTLLILTADHGHITTHIDQHYELRNHPELISRLHITPTGENRLAYLHNRPGEEQAILEYIEQTWPGKFNLIKSQDAIDAGLFGPGQPHPGLQDRVGDTTVIAQEDAYLWWANKGNHLIGRHGGLHPQEMLVPFLTVRL